MNPAFTDYDLDAMKLLNEISQQFPDAISLAAGRPMPDFFRVSDSWEFLQTYIQHASSLTGINKDDLLTDLGQYGRTKGVIHEAIAKLLQNDFDAHIEPNSVVVTAGCQEAMLLCLMTIVRRQDMVVLVEDPCYVGIVGPARLLGMEIRSVRSGQQDGIDLDHLECQLKAISSEGKKPAFLYVAPDYSNPLGSCMSISNRKRLLGIAKTASLRIVEDNAYGYFYFGSKPQPSLLSLDQDGLVIFLGSFAKSIFPGMRMAFIAMRDGSVNGVTSRALVDNLTLTKSFTTLNTSPILQAMVGGVLIKEGYSLFKYTDRSRRFYRSNRDLMIACLENEFGKAVERKKKYADLTWSIPEGGFFITIELSRPVSTPELLKCAGEYGVIWMPVSLFSLNPEPARLIRLAFSSQSADRIVSGIEKLARFIKCNDIGCVSAIYDK